MARDIALHGSAKVSRLRKGAKDTASVKRQQQSDFSQNIAAYGNIMCSVLQ